jgi:hypothetical protein
MPTIEDDRGSTLIGGRIACQIDGDAADILLLAQPTERGAFAQCNLQDRLARTRFPVAPDAPAWHFGTDPAFLRDLIARWRQGYDWRAAEARLNALGSSMTRIEDLEVHFLIERGSGANPFPLVLTHGWPGSIAEFLDIVDLLAHPQRHGGDPADGFTVVIPSIPGFGFSAAPPNPLTPRDVARMWGVLMRRLGFDRYGAHGGDLGGCVTGWMGHDDPAIAAIHMNMQVLFPHASDFEANPPDASEADWIARGTRSMARERVYQAIQGTSRKLWPMASTIPLPAWPPGSWKSSRSGRTRQGTRRPRSRLRRSSPTSCFTGWDRARRRRVGSTSPCMSGAASGWSQAAR